MSVSDESLQLKFAMSLCKTHDVGLSIYLENLKLNESEPETKEAQKVENEFVDSCLPKKEDDSSWEKLSDVGSVTSINSEITKKPEFTIDRQEIGPLPAPRSLALVTIYRYKNRDYKIPTTVMENFDYPGEVVDYIKDCESEDFQYQDDEEDDYHDHNRSSLCSNKDVYQ